MPIETICKGCARKLRVADEHAGRKARCPHCKTVYDVPIPSELSSRYASSQDRESLRSEAASVGSIDSAAMWEMRTADGAVYGPVSRNELDEWYRDGRIPPDAELLRQGSTSWVRATAVYADLSGGGVSSSNPFGSNVAPQTAVGGSGPYQLRQPTRGYSGAPHRGGLVLTFGILSWVLCVFNCFIINVGFAIAAWTMGRADLAAMREGRMDPSGQSLTQAGVTLGMVNIIVCIAAIVLGIAFFLVGAIANAF